MPGTSGEPTAYEIESELRTPPPRPVRLRPRVAEVMHRQWRRFILAILFVLSLYALLLVMLSLPDWFGQIVPARVTYQGEVFYLRSRSQSPCAMRRAHLAYEWRGIHHVDNVTVAAQLPESFPDGSVAPVKVLPPWQPRIWTPRDVYFAHLYQRSLWEAFGVLLLPLILAIALSYNFAWAGGRGRKRLVSMGTPIVGYIVGRPAQDKLPKYGPVSVVFKYVDPTAMDMPHPEDSMLEGVQKVPVQLMALVPSVGQPVTVLLPASRFALPQLYVVNLYEAVLPSTERAPTPTSAPPPKTG